MIKRFLKMFGFYEIRTGFSCGRHWVEIDGKMIAQTERDEMYLPDEDVKRLQQLIDQ